MQEKEWRDFRDAAVKKGDKKGITEEEIFILWVLFHMEIKSIDNVTDYNKAILLAAQATEESPDFDEDEDYVRFCIDNLEDRGLIEQRETMPFIKQMPNDFIKGGLRYVH